MPDPGYELRPDAETFDYAGCRVALVDAPGILEAARSERVELLHDAVFPPPVRQVRYWVATGVRDGRPAHLLEADVHTSAGGLDWLGPAVLGNDPIGALLARRHAAGDPRVSRIVDSVGNAAVEAYRRLGLGRPAGGKDPEGPVVREDPETGLRATVTYEASPTPDGPSGADLRVTALRAVVGTPGARGRSPGTATCSAGTRTSTPPPRLSGSVRAPSGSSSIRWVACPASSRSSGRSRCRSATRR
jgi:hypothetical protein